MNKETCKECIVGERLRQYPIQIKGIKSTAMEEWKNLKLRSEIKAFYNIKTFEEYMFKLIDGGAAIYPTWTKDDDKWWKDGYVICPMVQRFNTNRELLHGQIAIKDGKPNNCLADSSLVSERQW